MAISTTASFIYAARKSDTLPKFPLYFIGAPVAEAAGRSTDAAGSVVWRKIAGGTDILLGVTAIALGILAFHGAIHLPHGVGTWLVIGGSTSIFLALTSILGSSVSDCCSKTKIK